MTKGKAEKVEEVKNEETAPKTVTQKEFLENQLQYLEDEISKRRTEVEDSKASLNQFIGAKDFVFNQLNLIKQGEEIKK